MLDTGIRGEASEYVTERCTAAHMGSGMLEVYATPAMCALMEQAAWQSVQQSLAPGKGTVGTRMDIRHIAPSPIGAHITAKSELIRIDGRTLTFRVEAFDNTEKIGEGEHDRVIITESRFFEKAQQKIK